LDNPEGRPADAARTVEDAAREQVSRALRAVKAAQRDLNDAKRALGRLLHPVPVTSRMPRAPASAGAKVCSDLGGDAESAAETTAPRPRAE
jgi:hypothetical protein